MVFIFTIIHVLVGISGCHSGCIDDSAGSTIAGRQDRLTSTSRFKSLQKIDEII